MHLRRSRTGLGEPSRREWLVARRACSHPLRLLLSSPLLLFGLLIRVQLAPLALAWCERRVRKLDAVVGRVMVAITLAVVDFAFDGCVG